MDRSKVQWTSVLSIKAIFMCFWLDDSSPIPDSIYFFKSMLSSLLHGNNHCDTCPVTPCYSPKEVNHEQFDEAKWNIVEPELEEALLRNLDMIFKSAIKKIMSHGYEEEIAIISFLRTELSFGTKDTVTSIVDNAVIYLKSGHEFDHVVKEKLSEELNEREMSVVNEMIGVIQDFRPSISRGEAMWRLLVCDMNVSYACSIGGSFSSASQVEQEHNSSNINVQINPESEPAKEKVELNVFGVPSLPNGCFSASSNDSSSSLNNVIKGISSLSIPRPKSSSRKRGHSGKRESFLRLKSIRYEKRYGTYGSKASKRTSKLNSLNDLLSDMLSKTFLGPNALNMNTSAKLNKAPTDISSEVSSFKDMPMKMTDSENTELFLSSPSACNDDNLIMLDKMDKVLEKLSAYEMELLAVNEEWNEWAQRKVMEAAHELGKVKPELQSLRQEKDKVARLKMDKLAEMETAHFNACKQMDKYLTETRNKGRENVELKEKLAALKLQAADSAASFREISKKKNKDDINVRSQQREKCLLQGELVTEKKKSSQLKQQLEQAKEHYHQLEDRWKKEETVKLELLGELSSIKKERDQIEVSGKSMENTVRLKAETDLQKHLEYGRKLELQISQLSQEIDASKITALKKWSNDPLIDNNSDAMFKLFELQDEDGVDRERECVMCLSEEVSVLFLPCAHLVVCEACNEMHEKQGMKDCPSCRTNIEKRIIVCSG